MYEIISPFEDDGPNVVLRRHQREERLLLAKAEKPVYKLLFLCPRTTQMECLSQSFEFRGWQEIERFSKVPKVTLFLCVGINKRVGRNLHVLVVLWCTLNATYFPLPNIHATSTV